MRFLNWQRKREERQARDRRDRAAQDYQVGMYSEEGRRHIAEQRSRFEADLSSADPTVTCNARAALNQMDESHAIWVKNGAKTQPYVSPRRCSEVFAPTTPFDDGRICMKVATFECPICYKDVCSDHERDHDCRL
jgi:hypothetical protein